MPLSKNLRTGLLASAVVVAAAALNFGVLASGATEQSPTESAIAAPTESSHPITVTTVVDIPLYSGPSGDGQVGDPSGAPTPSAADLDGTGTPTDPAAVASPGWPTAAPGGASFGPVDHLGTVAVGRAPGRHRRRRPAVRPRPPRCPQHHRPPRAPATASPAPTIQTPAPTVPATAATSTEYRTFPVRDVGNVVVAVHNGTSLEFWSASLASGLVVHGREEPTHRGRGQVPPDGRSGR